MRRVLMLCYYFPPLGGIASLRALKLATYLPAFGWEPHVVAPRDGTFHRDPSLSFPEERVTRTASLEMSRAGKRMVGAPVAEFTAAEVGPLLGRLRAAARRWLYYPDPQRGWAPFALSAARAALRARRFDAVFSSSVPITAHVVARRLAGEAGLPWLAEYRDPWTPGLPAGHPHLRRARLLERALVEAADAVVTPSDDWARLFTGLGARRVEVVTNGVDPADLPALPLPGEPVLAFLGTFYPDRQSLAALWPAVRALREHRPLLRLRFIGALDARLREELRAQGLDAAVEATGFLPHVAALRALASASVLLVAGAREAWPERVGEIPAKTWEYLATDRPIVYVGHPGTEVARLLSGQPGCWIVPAQDEARGAAALRGALAGAGYARDVSAFTRRALAGRVARLLDEVTERA
jgi:glycosyltransferase involved in cell wall biosynthesis